MTQIQEPTRTAAATVRDWLTPLGVELDSGLDSGLGGDVPGGSCPHLDWAASGAMELSGDRDARPVLAPGPVVPLLHELGLALGSLTGRPGRQTGLDPGLVLGARAGARRLVRGGQISAGGATRMLRAADGWCAISLARPDDLAAVPAIVESDPEPDAWAQLARAVATSPAAAIVERVRLFGVPAAVLGEVGEQRRPGAPWQVERIAPTGPGRLRDALVVDLSSLWAGPLCAQLLGRSGARVIKVESTRRPDGARSGDPLFYDWLHGGHESVAVDFSDPRGRTALGRLIAEADVVIEASRPRALAQLGLAPDQVVLRPGAVWVSITGHGRDRPDLVAFGDDAAVAGGLVGGTASHPVFCGDAIADPLTGVVAAVGAAAARSAGGGVLLDISMAAVAATFADAPLGCDGEHPVRHEAGDWFAFCTRLGRDQRVLTPRRPRPAATAATSGADTARVLGASYGSCD